MPFHPNDLERAGLTVKRWEARLFFYSGRYAAKPGIKGSLMFGCGVGHSDERAICDKDHRCCLPASTTVEGAHA